MNYRPISMLPFLSKIFEILMCAKVDSYLKSNNILCTNQFGFHKNSNASDSIIEFLDYVYSSLDSKQSTITVYLYFVEKVTHKSPFYTFYSISYYYNVMFL